MKNMVLSAEMRLRSALFRTSRDILFDSRVNEGGMVHDE